MISIILTDLSFTTFLIENTTQLKDFNSINYRPTSTPTTVGCFSSLYGEHSVVI